MKIILFETKVALFGQKLHSLGRSYTIFPTLPPSPPLLHASSMPISSSPSTSTAVGLPRIKPTSGNPSCPKPSSMIKRVGSASTRPLLQHQSPLSPLRASPSLGRCHRPHVPSLDCELLGAEKHLLFVIGNGGVDDGFLEVGLMDGGSTTVEVEGEEEIGQKKHKEAKRKDEEKEK